MLMKSLDTTIVVQRNWGVWGVTVIRGVTTTSVMTAVEDAEVNRDVTMMAMHTRRLGSENRCPWSGETPEDVSLGPSRRRPAGSRGAKEKDQ
jgi:hypothetical protein